MHGRSVQTCLTSSSSTATLLQRETLLRRFQTVALHSICHSLLPVRADLSLCEFGCLQVVTSFHIIVCEYLIEVGAGLIADDISAES